MTVKLDTDHIRAAGIFERLTGVHVRDCLIDEETAYFLVEEGKMGMAIGKNGGTIKSVGKALGKSVKIFEYASTPEALIKNMVPNVKNIEKSDSGITISIPQSERSTVIGKNGKNIKTMREFLDRHFKVKNLRLK